MKPFCALLIPVLAAGCAREDQQVEVPDLAAANALVRRLDQAFNQRDAGSYLDNFEPEDIIVVERQGNGSAFIHPDPQALEEWLKEYTLGETWEKNIIGGGPH